MTPVPAFYRRLGKTELKVSQVGFGAWQLGSSKVWGDLPDATAISMVHKALDLGCNLFDTAPNYSNANSERLLGAALKGRRDDAVVMSKFGHPAGGGEDFSPEGMRSSLEQSLKRLQTDYLDVLLLHSPPPQYLDGGDRVWDALRKARDEGKIRFYGASVDLASQMRACLETSDAHVLEILFNILHQDARRAFDLVRDKDVGIVTKVPLDSGWLSGKYDASSTFTGVRARWSPEQIAHRADLIRQLAWLTEDGTPLSQKALAYLLAYDEVSSVIPGARSPEQLELNLASASVRITPEERATLEKFWDHATGGGEHLLPW